MNRTTSALVVVLCLAAVGNAAIKTYEVVPCSNYVARAGEYEPVTQYFRNTVDSLWKVSVWDAQASGPEACADETAA